MMMDEAELKASLRSKVAIVNKKFYNATSNMQNISKMVVQIDSYDAVMFWVTKVNFFQDLIIVQVNLCKKHLFLDQLTHNMT